MVIVKILGDTVNFSVCQQITWSVVVEYTDITIYTVSPSYTITTILLYGFESLRLF